MSATEIVSPPVMDTPPTQVQDMDIPATTPPAPPSPKQDGDGPEFTIPVDELGKAKKVQFFREGFPFLDLRRPHMRAFHFAWFSFFLAFFGWFALAPLQGEIRDSSETPWLNSTNFKNQNIIAVAGTILMRLAVGPFCDRFGPRTAQSILLGVFSIPVFLVSTSNTYWQWTLSRFFIGFIGAAFVVTQFWTSVMFSGNIVGTANATSAGWGNLGGGVTNAIMPLIATGIRNSLGFQPSPEGEDTSPSQLQAEDKAWRISMVIPGAALILTSIAMFFLSDDLPQGNYKDLHRQGKKEKTNPFIAMLRATRNWRVWILFLLYAGCFGIELIMNLNLATYFRDRFGLPKTTAGLIAGLFGLMNLFARSLGGVFSDVMAAKFAMRGRLWAFFIVQLCEGIVFVTFSRIGALGAAIPVLILFSLFVQMSEGCTFGVVPFVDPPATGAVSGIVGAGGNVGAVAGGFLINSSKELEGLGIADGFFKLGFCVIGSAFLIPFLYWPQYGGMFCSPKAEAKILEEE